MPTGIGLSLLAGIQWNNLHKYGYPAQVDDRPELLNDVVVMSCQIMTDIYAELSHCY